MKYEVSVERSAELLRLALPMMSKQAAALHPISYAVWYEYVGQTNPALRAAIDQVLATHGKLDEAGTQALFRQHVAEIDPDTGQRVADGFQRVLSSMAESAAQAGDQTAKFGTSLSRLRTEPGSSDNTLVGEVLGHTRDMQASMARLQKRLDDSLSEINNLRSEVQRARHEALVDSLTGLANRRAFQERLAACLAEHAADTRQVAPCLVAGDIDHFKLINDRYGHGFGDQVLRAVGQILKSVVAEPGMAARVGGEEFILLLPAAPLADAEQVAERVRATVAASRVRRKGGEVIGERLTISLGVTHYLTGEAMGDFVDRADRALYESKNAGRDRVTVLGHHAAP